MSQRVTPLGNACVTGFVRAQGREIVNGEGSPFLLRGVGLGSWLLPEGYMWRMPEGADRPRRIEALVRKVVGPAEAERFWHSYWDRFVTESDVERIAWEGFNSIRLPINARYLTGSDDSSEMIEERLQRIDRFIRWCRAHRLYVVLDLHGAPGGQTGTNIDDSPADRPDLFIEKANQERTVSIWRTLAERYKDEWIIAGYDLLNEPLPEWFSQYNDQVMPLYRRITEAIREVDTRHMIVLEGAHWATDWSIFTEMFDDNVLLQFHKYWNNPDRESIAPYLDARERLNVPIYMGEGGENNVDWYAGAFRLYEDLDISWNFWTWKKLDTTNSPASIPLPAGWGELASYAESGAKWDDASPPEGARAALYEFLDSVALERCHYHEAVVNSLFRRPPVRIPAIFYAFDGHGVGFGTSTGTRGGTPRIDYRRGDGTTFGYVAADPPRRGAPNFHHNSGEPWEPEEWLYLLLEPGSWAAYDFAVPPTDADAYQIGLQLATAGAAGSAGSADPDAAAVLLTIDSPRQELSVPVGSLGPDFSIYWIDARAEPGLRRATVQCTGATLRLEAVYVRMADTGGD
ncbi:MAG: cellulase family glycosylhydrolase [Alkalispirochaeta sp.]